MIYVHSLSGYPASKYSYQLRMHKLLRFKLHGSLLHTKVYDRLGVKNNLCTNAGVGNLRLASQMWLFWWWHLTRLIFS